MLSIQLGWYSPSWGGGGGGFGGDGQGEAGRHREEGGRGRKVGEREGREEVIGREAGVA